MSDDPAARIARAAAARLASDHPGLPAAVETQLARDPFGAPSERVIDPISLAGLLVSIAGLGWTIWRDLRADRAAANAPDRTAQLVAALRAAASADGLAAHDPARIETLIAAVAPEIIAADP